MIAPGARIAVLVGLQPVARLLVYPDEFQALCQRVLGM